MPGTAGTEAFHTTERAACQSKSGAYSSEPVRSSQPDSKFLCNRAPRRSRMPQIGNRGLIDISAQPPEPLAFRTSIAESCTNPLLNQCALKLRHGSDNLKHQPARPRAAVQVVSQAYESNPESLQFRQGVYQVAKRPAEPV
jgi:hypothetical protein